MTRIVKEHDVRRNEILKEAKRLVYSEGYEQMAVQEILDKLRIAKGTFYYYFDSKDDLLQAIIDEIVGEAKSLVTQIAEDSRLPAVEKLNRVLAVLARERSGQRRSFLLLLRAWYSDDNALVRHRVSAARVKSIAPLVADIIRQGILEGAFKTSHAECESEVVLSLLRGFEDSIAGVLLAIERRRNLSQRIVETVLAYTDALESLLGARAHSIRLVDTQTYKEWLALAGG